MQKIFGGLNLYKTPGINTRAAPVDLLQAPLKIKGVKSMCYNFSNKKIHSFHIYCKNILKWNLIKFILEKIFKEKAIYSLVKFPFLNKK